jgi:hypothetical protein
MPRGQEAATLVPQGDAVGQAEEVAADDAEGAVVVGKTDRVAITDLILAPRMNQLY